MPFKEMIAITRTGAPLSPDDERQLITELAWYSVQQVASHELAVFPETADDYFRRPGQVGRSSHRDEAVGFGVDLALLTPYVLAIATVAVQTVMATFTGAVQAEGMPAARSLVRRVFRLPDPESTGHLLPLTQEQARLVYDRARSEARALNLPDDTAEQLAISIVGRLVVGK